jgi:uncharacterized protein (DUF2267 family)
MEVPVTYLEFLATVGDRGENLDRQDAESAALAVLAVLAERLTAASRCELAIRLPDELSGVLLAPADAPPAGAVEPAWDLEWFLTQVADELAESPEAARQAAEAVLSTVADAISDRQLDQILAQLPPGYADLFCSPDLALLLPA